MNKYLIRIIALVLFLIIPISSLADSIYCDVVDNLHTFRYGDDTITVTSSNSSTHTYKSSCPRWCINKKGSRRCTFQETVTVGPFTMAHTKGLFLKSTTKVRESLGDFEHKIHITEKHQCGYACYGCTGLYFEEKDDKQKHSCVRHEPVNVGPTGGPCVKHICQCGAWRYGMALQHY